MAFPSVTNNFANSTTADATQVNQNFTDLLNAFSDGTKDLSMSAGTFAGTLTASAAFATGAVTTTVATNGGSSTVANTTSVAVLAPAGTIATYALTLPAAPAEGQHLYVVTNGNTITALTLAANTGHTIATGAGVARLQAGSALQLIFKSTVWYRGAFYEKGGDLIDSLTNIVDNSDTTKKIAFDASGITTATTRTFTAPDKSGTMAVTVGTHRVIVDTGNGYGATSTSIRRFSNNSVTGTAISYADSANLGATFTIVDSGIYAMALIENTGAGATNIGISVNSNQLTTDVGSITEADRVALTGIANNFNGMATVVMRLAASDVVRVHGGTANGTTGVKFRIEKVCD